MADPIEQLEELAAGAEVHARQEHGASIGLDNVSAADRTLHSESQRLDPRRLEMLAACYGAWLGRLAVRRWNARWVGLAEPAAPRLNIGGILVSPVDAVRRRLLDPAAPTLAAIVRKFESWAHFDGSSAGKDNRAAWDRLADDARFSGVGELPPDPVAALAALDDWIKADGVAGKKVLCLAAGGGRHGPLLALAGAMVTVVDFSERQLEHDRQAAAALKLDLRAVCASIDDLKSLESSSFDCVIQPVSSCYVQDVSRIHAEVARVLRQGGLYVVQHKQPASLQTGEENRVVHASIEGARLPPWTSSIREAGTTEYLHTLDTLLGGLCRAGFVIEDFVEPPRGDALAPPGAPEHRAWFLPPYVKIKARRL